MTSYSSIFEREVLLDIAVNIVPMAILAVLAGLYLFNNHWAHGPILGRFLQFALIAVPFFGLGIVTYIAARQVEVLEDANVGP